MNIRFCGAARTVTGSSHLISVKDKKILLDCGLYQGKREESFRMNKNFLFEPSELDGVILSHAHIDHAGNIPTLVKKGFSNTIYSTPATYDLCSIMLIDSAYVQEKDVEFVNKRRLKKGEPLFNPLYKTEEAKKSLEYFKTSSYRSEFSVNGLDDIRIKLFDAGHILGSSMIRLEIPENGRTVTVGFTGDLGRKNLPILKDPDFMGDVDYLIIESTYGGILHEDAETISKSLTETILDALSLGGKIIVPSFSVGRTQELVYEITKLTAAGKIPRFPVFVDSPLSVNATEVFKMHPECFDDETYELIAKGINVFGMDNVAYISDVEDSKKLNESSQTMMIISASGMCEAGRILHHLANNIGNPKNTVMIIGYMGANTLGRELIKASDKKGYKVRIFGDEHTVKAKIKTINAFSAHADNDELIDYVKLFNRKKLRKIFLVHGEPPQQENLKANLEKEGFSNIFIPERGDSFEI